MNGDNTTQSTAAVTMVPTAGGDARAIPPDQVDAAKAAGWEPAFKMVGAQGDSRWIPESQVASARQAKFAVTPDNAGTQKMVSPQGQVNYVLPGEVQGFRETGHTLIAPDGSFSLQNIPGEDPLDEAKRYQLVRKALTAQEKSGANKAELKEFAKSGVDAALNTASGVSGAEGVGAVADALTAAKPIVKEVGTGIFDSAGKEITKKLVTEGPSAVESAISKLGPKAIKAGFARLPIQMKWILGLAGSEGLNVGGNAIWDAVKPRLAKGD